ncbi:hypothetical protein V8N76_004528 [Salmonella enterica]
MVKLTFWPGLIGCVVAEGLDLAAAHWLTGPLMSLVVVVACVIMFVCARPVLNRLFRMER